MTPVSRPLAPASLQGLLAKYEPAASPHDGALTLVCMAAQPVVGVRMRCECRVKARPTTWCGDSIPGPLSRLVRVRTTADADRDRRDRQTAVGASDGTPAVVIDKVELINGELVSWSAVTSHNSARIAQEP